MPRTLAALAGATSGRLIGADREFGALIADSRRMQPGGLFVCLKGPRFDGHDFAERALRAGAAGVLAERAALESEPRVEVPDTRAALARFARVWRDAHDVRVVGVTGSNGKTTTKNLLAAILARQAPTLATRGNLNNRIGLPLTLARLDATHRYAVAELGISLPGEMAELAETVHADAAIVTNVAPAHLEGFGSIAGVAREKSRLPASLPAGGLAVAPADLRWLPAWRERFAVRNWLTFGFDERADVQARSIATTPAGSRFELVVPGGRVGVRLPLLGRHNIANALAAAAIAAGFGLDARRIARGLAEARPEPGRMVAFRLASGAVLIDDTYNANPASLRAALETAAGFERPVWLALGELGELGEEAARWHARAGRGASRAGVRRLAALGPLAAHAAAAFGDGGKAFSNRDDLVEWLLEALPPEAVLLVKGSRSARMDCVAAALREGA